MEITPVCCGGSRYLTHAWQKTMLMLGFVFLSVFFFFLNCATRSIASEQLLLFIATNSNSEHPLRKVIFCVIIIRVICSISLKSRLTVGTDSLESVKISQSAQNLSF